MGYNQLTMGPPAPRPAMMVYMLLNTITERAYVGATDKTLEERWQRHLNDSRSGSAAPLHVALREWPEALWLPVVLVNCYTTEELSAAEAWWIERTEVHDPQVGYNDGRASYVDTVTNGKRGGNPLVIGGDRETSPLNGKTPEQRRQYFSDCGKRGAAAGRKGAKPKAEMTEADRERYREWGRKGAARSKELAGKA